ncbi:MAG: hypothetical protein E6Q36_08415 [Chryseobacterium sp.]|nr:MAG: hypothetical protein E6Q36_08415 [Chryseobacterium sp.]
MLKPLDAFGKEIRPGQFIIYATAAGHALSQTPGLVIRVTDKQQKYTQYRYNTLSVLVPGDGLNTLQKLAGVVVVDRQALPADVVNDLLNAYECRFYYPIDFIDQEERYHKDDIYVGADIR